MSGNTEGAPGRARDASSFTAAGVGLVLPVLEVFARESAVRPLTWALAFAAVLFGVIGRTLPGALLQRRHLSPLGWPLDEVGRALWRDGGLRLLALAAAFMASSLVLGRLGVL